MFGSNAAVLYESDTKKTFKVELVASNPII